MRVVFMGTPEFAVPTLRALHEHHQVVGVYTRPDAVSGRGSRSRGSAVKAAAVELGLPVFQPQTLRSAEAQSGLRALRPDIIVVAAYGLILPPEVLEAAPLGAVNVHASLLPRWRGAAPVQRAILAGDDTVGVSIMRMEEGLDTGPYSVCRSVEMGAGSAPDVTQTLAELGADALVQALDDIVRGACTWVEQDESAVTYAEKISKDDVALSPALPALEIVRRVRASSPQAPSRLSVDGRTLTALDARTCDASAAAGEVVSSKEGLIVGAADGCVLITSVKPDGRAAMRASDWIRGAHLPPDVEWGPA